MPTHLVVYPDACEVVCPYLAYELGVHVGTRVPTSRPSTFVVVRRLGGPRLNLVADNAMLGVECWADSEQEAQDLAQLSRGLIHALRGTSQDGVAVYRITEVAGPQELPDPDSDQCRYVFTLQIAMRGTSAVAS